MARDPRLRRILGGIAAGILAALACGIASSADDDAPGNLRFRGHVTLGDVDGEFHRWRITRAVVDDSQPERSEVDIEVDVGSLDTRNSTRDRHLKSETFLDVAQYPTATARLRDVHIEGPAEFSAQLDLELHGQTHTLPMRFTIVDRIARRVAGSVTLKRSDFGIGTPRGGIFQVSDEVRISVDTVVPTSLAEPGT